MPEKPNTISKEALEQMEALMKARRQYASVAEKDIEIQIDAQSQPNNTVKIEVNSCGIRSTRKIKSTSNL